MDLIATQTLDASAGRVEFADIPTDFTDLVVLVSARSDIAATSEFLLMYINTQETSTNYRSTFILGNGSTVTTTTFTRTVGVLNGATSTANTFSSTQIILTNYQNTRAKQLVADSVSENNATAADQRITGYFRNDSEIVDNLIFDPQSGLNFVAGSTFSLYGITAA